MRRLIVVLALLLAGGCATMAPERTLPTAPVDASWNSSDRTGADVDETGWRDAFPDPALQELIATALLENRSLRQTVLAMEQARAQFRIAGADRIPSVDAAGSKTSNRLPSDLNGGIAGINRQWASNLGVTAFELDFFGRVQSLEDEALESYLATEEARRAAHISLVAQVAQGYLTLVGDRESLDLARETSKSREATLALTKAQLDNGLATELDRHQAEETAAVAQSEVARLEARTVMDENALAVLVGVPASQLRLPARAMNDVAMAGPVEPGLPSELLTRRPDILEAEHRLWSAGAQIGAARAAFFPRITLTGTAGFASLGLSDLFDAQSRAWTFIPRVSLPIFDAGRNKANLALAESEQKIRVAQYEQAVQTAFREVADALAKNKGFGEQIQAQTRRAASAEKSRVLVDQRYQAGLESAMAVHDAERTLFTARQDLLSVRMARKLAIVELYAALGGGWEERHLQASN